AGFGSNIVAFLSNGNSSYSAGSAQVTHRLANGLQGSAAYTWSHLIDDTTAEVFSTVLSPRRVQDFQNLRAERADSALDHRQRFILSLIYDVPFFRNSRNFVRTIAGGWSLAGTYSAEAGEKAAVRSGIDSNLNGDNAGDRTILNPSGVSGTGSTVVGVGSDGKPASSQNAVVAYVATNPNAQYIQAGKGAFATAGRNNLPLPGVNNLDFSIFKNFRVREGMKFQFRVDMYNAFNHAQFVPGSVNGVEATAQTTAAATNLVTVGTADFNRPDLVFTSHPRVIQLALRFDF
ncbi:MAG: carboxypeptidase regulatory-like domain-containing protein, partial [Blastocatellia bacterium]